MHTGKHKQMNASYQASLVNRHIRRFTGNSLRARPKAERVFAEYENLVNLSDPTDRDAFQRLISFEPYYLLTNGLHHLKATFNKLFALA